MEEKVVNWKHTLVCLSPFRNIECWIFSSLHFSVCWNSTVGIKRCFILISTTSGPHLYLWRTFWCSSWWEEDQKGTMTTDLSQSAWWCLQLMLACVIGAFLRPSYRASCYTFCRCVLAWSEPSANMTEQFCSSALLFWRFKNSVVVVLDVPTNTFDTTTKKENRKIQFLESWFMDFRVFGFF